MKTSFLALHFVINYIAQYEWLFIQDKPENVGSVYFATDCLNYRRMTSLVFAY